MAWSGGNFTRANPTWASDAANGIGIEAGRHDTQDNDFKDGIDQCLNKTGQNGMSGTLSMGNNKITNLAAATLRNDAAQVGQVQDGDYVWLGTTGGTATAQTASATPAITAYKAGQKFRAIIGAGLGSTGVTANGHTININGIGTKQIVSNDGLNSSPTAGSWIAGAVIELLYDGTYMRIMNDPSGWADWAPNLRSGTATVVTPTYTLAKFRKQGKQVTLVFNLNCGISVAGSTILADLPVACADTGVIWIATGFGAFSGGVSYIGQCYVNTSTELTIQQNLLTSTNWTVTAAPNAGTRGVLTYRGV